MTLKHIRRLAAALLLPVLLAACGAAEAGPASGHEKVLGDVVSDVSNRAEETPETETWEPEGPGLPYDEMRPVAGFTYSPNTILPGYFTVSQNGRWGLIRADGTELLPCEGMAPVAVCFPEDGHWIWYRQDPLPGEEEWDYRDALSAQLAAMGEPEICGGHGGMTEFFLYDPADGGYDPGALRCYFGYDGPGEIGAVPDGMWDFFGDIVPVYYFHVIEQDDEPPYVEQAQGDSRCFFAARDGGTIELSGAQDAGWFFDQPLAPVKDSDGRWYYIDRSGRNVTGAVYDAVFDCDNYWETGDAAPLSAAYLQNGYAAVRRGELYGLLDGAGVEVIPCQTAGVAWEGTTLWCKTGTGWHRRELPPA